jgi:YcxB-like protein
MNSSESGNPYQPLQTEVCRLPSSIESAVPPLGPTILVRGKLNREELQWTVDLHNGHRKPRTRRWLFMRVLSAALAISALVLLSQHLTWIPSYLWLAFTLYASYWSFIQGPRSYARMLDKLERDAAEYDVLISDQGIGLRNAEGGFQHEWASISGFRDTESLILLYVGSGQLPIARRWFSSEGDWERLIIFLGHRIEMLS